MTKYLMILIALLSFSYSSDDGGKEAEVPQNPETKTLKVMTYNIHIANPPSREETFVDLPAIANAIITESPDLVALQEVDRFTDRSGKDLDQAKELAELTGMHYYFAKALNRSNGEYGVALLSKFPIKASIKHSLPGAAGGEAEMRAIGLIEVELEGGQKLYFASTHLDHLNDQNRLEQAKELISFLKPYQTSPMILGGDFNMVPTNPVWNSLRNFFEMGCSTCPGTFPASGATTTLDYFLLNDAASDLFTVTDYYTVQENYASDHLPVVMEMEYEL